MQLWNINSGFQIVNAFGGVNFIDPNGNIIGHSSNKRVGLNHSIILNAIEVHNAETLTDPQEENIIEGKKTNPLLIPAIIIGALVLL